MQWFDGSITFHDPERGHIEHAKVCFDQRGWLMYSLAEGMAYAVPVQNVLEVTLDGVDWRNGA